MQTKTTRTLTGKSRTHNGNDERQVLVRKIYAPDEGEQGIRTYEDKLEWWPEARAQALQK